MARVDHDAHFYFSSGMGLSISISVSISPIFQTYQNTGYLLNIMLLFDRCLNSVVVTPARYHYVSTWSDLLWQNQNCPNREISNPGWIPTRDQGADSVLRCHLTSIGILFIKIWQSHDHLIFIKEIPVVLIKTFLSSAASSAPGLHLYQHWSFLCVTLAPLLLALIRKYSAVPW